MDVIPDEFDERVYMGGTATLTGLHGADLSASKARAPVSSPKSAIFSCNSEGISTQWLKAGRLHLVAVRW